MRKEERRKLGKVIIYGASDETKELYSLLAINNKDVLFYVDRDLNKIGNRYMGRVIYSPDILKDNVEIPIYITCTRSYREVYDYLKSIGMQDIRFLGDTQWCKKVRTDIIFDELNSKRCISLGDFLLDKNDNEIKLGNLPYIWRV